MVGAHETWSYALRAFEIRDFGMHPQFSARTLIGTEITILFGLVNARRDGAGRPNTDTAQYLGLQYT